MSRIGAGQLYFSIYLRFLLTLPLIPVLLCFIWQLVLGPGDGPNAQLLDYETANEHILDLTVEDLGGLSTDFSVKLEIMDVNEKPAVDAVKEMVVPENAYYTDNTGKSVYHLGKKTGKNHLVGTLTATDPDGPITTFKFSMVSLILFACNLK